MVRRYALLTVLCLALYLPGIAAIPPLDRDEARFAQASRQMLESGDFLDIRFQDEARNRKPAGIYWLQAAAAALVSTPQSAAIWPYRLPSLFGATAAAWLVLGLGQALLREAGIAAPERTAFIAATLLAAALAAVAEAHIAKTDAALLAATAAGQGTLGLAYLRRRNGAAVPATLAAGFWAAETAAVLLKGPVGPALAGVTAAALSLADRDWRWLGGLRPLRGLLAMAAAVMPWLVAIEIATSGRFLAESLAGDLAGKLAGAQESHGAPPLSYAVLSLATFWPGSYLLVPALSRGWQGRRLPLERLLLCWLLPAWAALELVPTKLPHYALPLYPALALLAALALAEGRTPTGWVRRADLAVKALWLLIGLGLAAALIAVPPAFAGRVSPAGIAGAVVLLAGIAWAWRRPLALPLLSVVLAGAGAAVLPGLDRLWLSRSAAALVAAHPAPGLPVAVGYGEPSLVFLLGTGLRLAGPEAAAAGLEPGGEALVAGADDAAFRQALAARGLAPQPLGSVSGLDYSNGKAMTLTLYGVK